MGQEGEGKLIMEKRKGKGKIGRKVERKKGSKRGHSIIKGRVEC